MHPGSEPEELVWRFFLFLTPQILCTFRLTQIILIPAAAMDFIILWHTVLFLSFPGFVGVCGFVLLLLSLCCFTVADKVNGKSIPNGFACHKSKSKSKKIDAY